MTLLIVYPNLTCRLPLARRILSSSRACHSHVIWFKISKRILRRLSCVSGEIDKSMESAVSRRV